MEELKINRKLLGECCRNVLLKSTIKSKTLRENISFVEQVKLCKEVSKMSDIEAICMIFNEGEIVSEDRIRSIEDSKIKTGLKYGFAAAAGGIIGGSRALAKHIGSGISKVKSIAGMKTVPAKPHMGMIKGALTVAALSVLALYVYRTLTDPCAKQCLTKFAKGEKGSADVSFCKKECAVKALNKMVATLKSQKAHCKDTANPEKCNKKLSAEISKWSTKLHTKATELSKLKASR